MIVGSPNPIVKVEYSNSKDNTFFCSLVSDSTYFEGKLLEMAKKNSRMNQYEMIYKDHLFCSTAKSVTRH